ncbi:UNVERIFIED_CONTAM: hypothetical protein K2H54_070503 [Gekko kuhli]
MCGAYELLWRFLHALLFAQRALFAWLREQLGGRGSWLGRWRRGAASVAAAASRALLVPAAATGFFAFHKPAVAGRKVLSNQSRWRRDGKSLQKLPGHVGLVVTEEEPSYADMASLVVWCMAVGISYVSVYDHDAEIKQFMFPLEYNECCLKKFIDTFVQFFSFHQYLSDMMDYRKLEAMVVGYYVKFDP